LSTDSLSIARERRDVMMDADEQLWETSLAKQIGIAANDSPEMCRYRLARRRALAVGFEFIPFPKLVESEPVEALVERVKTLESDEASKLDSDAVLGTIEPPKDTIRDAFKLYCDKLSISETSQKSPEQIIRWKETKSRAVEHFVALCGNLNMDEITRTHVNTGHITAKKTERTPLENYVSRTHLQSQRRHFLTIGCSLKS